VVLARKPTLDRDDEKWHRDKKHPGDDGGAVVKGSGLPKA